MDLAITNLVKILAGVIAISISVLVYIYFNGGIDGLLHNAAGLFSWIAR